MNSFRLKSAFSITLCSTALLAQQQTQQQQIQQQLQQQQTQQQQIQQQQIQRPVHTVAAPKDRVYLDDAIATLEIALNKYQVQEAVSPNGLPPLAKAEFEFKTVAQNSVSGGLDVFVFSLTGKHNQTRTSDLVFTFVPLQKPTLVSLVKDQSDAPESAMIDLINAAAKAIRKSPQSTSPNELGIDQVSITVSFALENEVGGSGKIPISIVTFGPKLDHDKTATQQVKLTFQSPPPKA